MSSEENALNPSSDYPQPASLVVKDAFEWDDDNDPVDNYVELGKSLAQKEDLFRNTDYGSGLLLAPKAKNIPPRPIQKASALSAVIVDRVRVKIKQGEKSRQGRIPSADLGIMLGSEAFLQKFRPIDVVSRIPLYLSDFQLTKPGYNKGELGYRIYYVGDDPQIDLHFDAITKFLDVMAFASKADRTNAIAAALTVMLHNHFPGAKPLIAVTANKSHAGKDTIILFTAGRHRLTGISYQAADWALEQSFVGAVRHSSDTVLVNVENARLGQKQKVIASGFLERLLMDPEPTLFSPRTGAPVRVRNNFVIAISTNYGMLSTDLMNRSLPIHLEPEGNVADRESAIGNPKLEFLPAQREQIEAELRGMIQNWIAAGKPLNQNVRHPFTQWAKTIGGILQVNGFTEFLANYGVRRTVQDPLRHGIGLIGAYCPDSWQTPDFWAKLSVELGLKYVIPEADRSSEKGRERGIGVVFSGLREETFHVETDSRKLVLQLQKSRQRWETVMKSILIDDCEVNDAGLNEYFTMTQIGKSFGVSGVVVGKWLVKCGLREKVINSEEKVFWVPTKKAWSGHYVKDAMSPNELPFSVWHKTRTIFALKQDGHVLLGME